MRGSKQLHNAAREVGGLSGVTRDNLEMRGVRDAAVVSEDLGGERVGYSVYVHIKQRKAANPYTVCERPESQTHFFIDFYHGWEYMFHQVAPSDQPYFLTACLL